MLKSSPWWWGWRAGELTNSAPTQAQNQDYEFANPNIQTIYVLLEHIKRLVLQIQSYRISMTQWNSKMSQRSPSVVPAEPEVLNKTNDSLQWTLVSKDGWTNNTLHELLCHTTASTMWFFIFFFLFFLSFHFNFILFCFGGGCRGSGQMQWDWYAWCDIHKESIKNLKMLK